MCGCVCVCSACDVVINLVESQQEQLVCCVAGDQYRVFIESDSTVSGAVGQTIWNK